MPTFRQFVNSNPTSYSMFIDGDAMNVQSTRMGTRYAHKQDISHIFTL